MSKKAYRYVEAVSHSEVLSVFKLLQDIVMDNIPSIQKEFLEIIKSVSIHNILFDFSLVNKADTAGVAVLIDLMGLMKKHHIQGQVGFVNVPKNLDTLLLVLNVTSLFKVFASEKEAREVLSKLPQMPPMRRQSDFTSRADRRPPARNADG